MECIDIHKAKELIDQAKVTIIDIRDAESYAQAHIDNAITVSDANVQAFIKDADKNVPLICCCYHGFSSQNAAMFFEEQGFKKVYSMTGGFEAWRANYPTVTI